MQLTKLRAAPVWQAEVPPCAPAGQLDGGTASQLIRSVGRTERERTMPSRWCWILGAAIALAASCRSAQPLGTYSPKWLKDCRGWMTEELPQQTVARIHGQVRDSQGYPVPGVTLVLSSPRPAETPLFAEVTRKNGKFAFRNVPAGLYVLKTCFVGFDTFEVPIQVDATAGDSPIDLAINPSA
jgi:hypothetical protein